MESRRSRQDMSVKTTLEPNIGLKQWYAIHTKYKCEKYVVDALLRKSIEAYSPLLTTVKQYTRKVVTRQIPLINCYVFVYISQDDFVRVLQTEYVFKFLKVGNELSVVRTEEIDILKRITGEFNEIVAEATDYTEGMEVEIIAGNLTGVKGKLIEKQSKHNFLVELESLSYQLKINIDPNNLRPIHKLSQVVI